MVDTALEIFAKKLADATGRTVACVPVNRMPRTDFSPMLTEKELQEMTEDFFDCVGPIIRVYPNDQTD